MRIVRTVLIVAIMAVSLANGTHALWQYYHWPVFQHDDMWVRDLSLVHARDELRKLGTTHIGYRPGPDPAAANVGEFFANQFLLAPMVLRRNGPEEPFVLVFFGVGKPADPMPGLVMVEDFKNGTALFRKTP